MARAEGAGFGVQARRLVGLLRPTSPGPGGVQHASNSATAEEARSATEASLTPVGSGRTGYSRSARSPSTVRLVAKIADEHIAAGQIRPVHLGRRIRPRPRLEHRVLGAFLITPLSSGLRAESAIWVLWSVGACFVRHGGSFPVRQPARAVRPGFSVELTNTRSRWSGVRMTVSSCGPWLTDQRRLQPPLRDT